MSDRAALVRAGLWDANPALVQLLGLSPLLAVSTSVVNGLGLGAATLLVVAASGATISLLRRQLSGVVRVPAWLLIIASFTTGAELLMQACAYPLYQSLGIFVPLIVANGMILSRAESFASKNPPLPTVLDGLAMGVGFALALLVMGAIREIVGSGTLFANLDLLLGPTASDWQLTILGGDYRFPLLLLPPGAFLVAGLLIALKNRIDGRWRERRPLPPAEPGAKRVRTTGAIN